MVLAGLCSCVQTDRSSHSLKVVCSDKDLKDKMESVSSEECQNLLIPGKGKTVTVRDFCSNAVGAHLLGYDNLNYTILDSLSRMSVDMKSPTATVLTGTIKKLYLWTGDKRLLGLGKAGQKDLSDTASLSGIPLFGTNSPETVFSVLGHISENLMGLTPFAPRDSFSVLSGVAPDFGEIGMTGIPIGEHTVNIIHNSPTSTSVSHISGDSDLNCTAMFYGVYRRISIGGTIFNSEQSVIGNKDISRVTVQIPVGTSVTIDALSD